MCIAAVPIDLTLCFVARSHISTSLPGLGHSPAPTAIDLSSGEKVIELIARASGIVSIKAPSLARQNSTSNAPPTTPRLDAIVDPSCEKAIIMLMLPNPPAARRVHMRVPVDTFQSLSSFHAVINFEPSGENLIACVDLLTGKVRRSRQVLRS